jgi:hypothetical protein
VTKAFNVWRLAFGIRRSTFGVQRLAFSGRLVPGMEEGHISLCIFEGANRDGLLTAPLNAGTPNAERRTLNVER